MRLNNVLCLSMTQNDTVIIMRRVGLQNGKIVDPKSNPFCVLGHKCIHFLYFITSWDSSRYFMVSASHFSCFHLSTGTKIYVGFGIVLPPSDW